MASHITSHQLSATEIALCGGVAGMTARLVISPLDVIKIRLQMQSQPYTLSHILTHKRHLLNHPIPTSTHKYNGIFHAARLIAKEEGIRGFFKGNMPAEYLYLTYGAAQYFAYHHLELALDKVSPVLMDILYSILFYSILSLYINQSWVHLTPPTRAFVCGMLSGSCATFITYPLDLLRTRFAVQGNHKVYSSVMGAVQEIYTKEGVRGLYQGLFPSMVQIMPYMGLMFLSYDSLCRGMTWLKNRDLLQDTNKRTQDMVCGSLASIISKTGVFPLDVVRKRWQVQGPHRADYVIASIPCYSRTSLWTCMQSILRKEGFLSLYKGLLPGLLKAGPAGAVHFLVFESAKDVAIYYKTSKTDLFSTSLAL
ncbi:mitochondrial carrier domain-containing protein [Spinellus fusiger]|nr:mitochondrial carrier domain-containing protein [Spinellus fusiger]